jgi:hypothetical protein
MARAVSNNRATEKLHDLHNQSRHFTREPRRTGPNVGLGLDWKTAHIKLVRQQRGALMHGVEARRDEGVV